MRRANGETAEGSNHRGGGKEEGRRREEGEGREGGGREEGGGQDMAGVGGTAAIRYPSTDHCSGCSGSAFMNFP